jgi:hypothetical protein
VDLAFSVGIGSEIVYLAPLVGVVGIELGRTHMSGQPRVGEVPLSNAETVARLDDRVRWYPEEEGAVDAAAQPQLLCDDMHRAVVAVAHKHGVLARSQHDVAVLAVVDCNLLAVVKDVDGAGLQVVDDELLSGDPVVIGPAIESKSAPHAT